MQTMAYDDFVALVREIISEAKRTQDKRLHSFTNNITRSIMAIYAGRNSRLPVEVITKEDMGVIPSTNAEDFYEIEAGVFPLALDPESIDKEVYEDGVDPFITVVVEIDKNSDRFNVSASDKSVTGNSDLGIHIAIETPPDFPVQKYKELRDEVANSVRHELEHVTQGEIVDQPARAYARDEKYFTFLNNPDSVDSSHAKYLLKPDEIPAHVRGYLQNSKSLRDLKQNIDSLLAGYVSKNLITNDEKTIVFDTWIDWASNNINRKGF